MEALPNLDDNDPAFVAKLKSSYENARRKFNTAYESYGKKYDVETQFKNDYEKLQGERKEPGKLKVGEEYKGADGKKYKVTKLSYHPGDNKTLIINNGRTIGFVDGDQTK